MHSLRYLPDVLLLLCVSVFIIVFLKKIKLSPVLGYLVAGIIIGKHGFDLIQEPRYSQNLAEFGIVFLLFVIGLELTIERLLRMRVHVFGFGGLQLLLTSSALSLIFYHFLGFSIAVSIVVSTALALSSTAIVLQVLHENRRQATQVGRLSFSVLLMQDFAVVPLLAVLPILSQSEDAILSAIGWSTLKALGAIIAFTLLGRIFIRPLFSIILSAKSDDVYVPTTLVMVLGAALITNNLGLSTAMGAFLAGLLIAETEYRNKVEASIMPFKSLFLGLFFMTVGMSINIDFIREHLFSLLIAALALMTVKASIIMVLCKLFRFPFGVSIHSSLLLCQGGEFAFILFEMAQKRHIIGEDISQFLLMMVAISMAITPLISIFGAWIESKLDSGANIGSTSQEYKGISDLDSHVIIAGFGRVGRVISFMLSQKQISYVAVDGNAQLVKKARSQGFPVYHGDSTDIDTFKSVGAQRAKAVILTITDKATIRKSVKKLSSQFEKLKIIVRAEDYKHGMGLRKLGADFNIPGTIEVGLQIGGAVLSNLGLSDNEITNLKDYIRKNDYSLTEEIELFRGIEPTKHIEH